MEYDYEATSFSHLNYPDEREKFRGWIENGWEPFLMSGSSYDSNCVHVIFRKLEPKKTIPVPKDSTWKS